MIKLASKPDLATHNANSIIEVGMRKVASSSSSLLPYREVADVRQGRALRDSR